MYDPRISFFNPVIDAMTETGIIIHFFDKYFPQKGIKEHENVTEEKLTYEHFLIPYVFLMCMLSICIAIILMEVSHKNRQNATMKKQNLKVKQLFKCLFTYYCFYISCAIFCFRTSLTFILLNCVPTTATAKTATT